jgi:hypothetical protein
MDFSKSINVAATFAPTRLETSLIMFIDFDLILE